MFRCLTHRDLTRSSQNIFLSPRRGIDRVVVPDVRSSSMLTKARALKAACSRPDCRCTESTIESFLEQKERRALSAERLRALGAEETFTKYNPLDSQHLRIMKDWYARGPPPISEYRLTFGKYKGKRLNEVPDVYLVKYMIPRREELHYIYQHHDPLVYEALADFLERNPDMKSQAGGRKTVLREGGIPVPPKKEVGRPRKAS